MADSYQAIHGDFTYSGSEAIFESYFEPDDWLYQNYYPADSCDFVLAFEFDGDLDGKTWNVDGDSTLRWYCEGSLLATQESMPTQSIAGAADVLIVTPADVGTGWQKLRGLNLNGMLNKGNFPDLVSIGADSVITIECESEANLIWNTELIATHAILRSLQATSCVNRLSGNWRDIWDLDSLRSLHINSCDGTACDLDSLINELPYLTSVSGSYNTDYTGTWSLIDGRSGFTSFRCRDNGMNGSGNILRNCAATLTTFWMNADYCSLAVYKDFNLLNTWSGDIDTLIGDMDTSYPAYLDQINVGWNRTGVGDLLKATMQGLGNRVNNIAHFEAEYRDSVSGDIAYCHPDSGNWAIGSTTGFGVYRITQTRVSGDVKDFHGPDSFHDMAEYRMDRDTLLTCTGFYLPNTSEYYGCKWLWFDRNGWDQAEVDSMGNAIYREMYVEGNKYFADGNTYQDGGSPWRLYLHGGIIIDYVSDDTVLVAQSAPSDSIISRLYKIRDFLEDSCEWVSEYDIRYTDNDHPAKDSAYYDEELYNPAFKFYYVIINDADDKPRWEY